MIEKLPKHSNNINNIPTGDYHYDEMGDKINELVDAVNRLIEPAICRICGEPIIGIHYH